MIIDYYAFIEFIRGLKGQTIYTMAKEKPFTVDVISNGLIYTPFSTMIPRTHSKNFIERVLERFETTKSLRPADYHDITVNASYNLALLKMYLNQNI
ncbi:MAG: hypothetical protein NC238_09065 [Dehalobacter sp.]|nr:hypothetical protein [Dehalobacter sp.]